MDERKDIEYRKVVSKFKKDSKIKECFHYEKESCSNQIISAHSIQRSGVLSLIEDYDEENFSVYSFLHRKIDQNGNYIGFEPLGKKVASTFSGFCGHHDTEVFKNIENEPVNLDDDEHCFLLSYRAFAKDYHAKKETLQGFKANEFYQQINLAIETDGLVSGSELGLRDAENTKNRMNQILERKSFDELDYFTYQLDYMIPLALAASFTPDYSYKNKLLNKSVDTNEIYEFVNFVIQPNAQGETQILFSCLPEHEKSITYINELSELSDIKLKKAISSIAIGHVENTFFSPKMWKKNERS